MMRVTIEIVPFGDEEKAHVIGKALIGLQNAGSEFGDYTVEIMEERFSGRVLSLSTTDRFTVAHHRRSDGAWVLAKRAIGQFLDLPARPQRVKSIHPHLVRGNGIIERICEHGTGHPVGSVSPWKDWMDVHGCDGCCTDYTRMEMRDGVVVETE